MHAFVKEMFAFWAKEKIRGERRRGKGERSHTRCEQQHLPPEIRGSNRAAAEGLNSFLN